MYMNRMVKSGSLNWGWAIDLGSSVINSYSFYLLGSPFFWLSCLFPYKAVPYIMPWLLMLKFAVGNLGAFGYLRRYAKNDNYAIIGALLYTFCGFSIYNIFFNHFIESVAKLPFDYARDGISNTFSVTPHSLGESAVEKADNLINMLDGYRLCLDELARI